MIEKYDIKEQLKRVVSNFKRTTPDLSIGFPAMEGFFDNRGFPDGTFAVILGKSKVGKTSMIVNSMLSLVRRGHKVLFFSLEMSSISILVKFARLILNQHPWRIRRIVQDDDDGVKYLVNKFRASGVFDYLKIVDGSKDRASVDTLYISKMMEEYKPRVIFIDHLHLIKAGYSSDIFAQTTANANFLANLAHKTNTTIVTLVQISRSDSGTKSLDGSVLPTLSGAKGSGAVEEAADCIIGIARPDISPGVSEDMRGKILLGILGNRFGESSPPITYYYDSDSTRLVFEDDYINGSELT